MQNKVLRTIVIIVAALIILVGSFSGGFLTGTAFHTLTATGSTPETGEPAVAVPQAGNGSLPVTGNPTAASDTQALFAPFWETWTIVHDQFVDQPVNDVLLMRGAIQGMLGALGDKHTSYMDPYELQQANISIEGEYEGIGAWVDITGEYLKVVSPMPGSPAEKAGLKPDDVVVGINGEDLTGKDGNLVLSKILGPAGTEVILTIRREGVEEPIDISITRARIVVPSVAGKMLDNNIAYIEVSSFGETTGDEFEAELEKVMANNPAGLILDLRFNGGGLITAAVEVASQLFSEDVVMYEQYGDGTLQPLKTNKTGLAREIPLVVLVNDGTASASEIVAGAIQDYQRGKLVGIQTYGKGSAQNWIELDNNQGAVRVTIARWLTPLQRQINEVGLTPDYIVELTEEDVAAERDPQLDKAIEVLLEK